MTPVYLLSKDGTRIGELQEIRFEPSRGAFIGQFVDVALPHHLRQHLSQLEELVEGQSFSCVDEVQREIDEACITAVFDDGSRKEIRDLYISGNCGISFRLLRND